MGAVLKAPIFSVVIINKYGFVLQPVFSNTRFFLDSSISPPPSSQKAGYRFRSKLRTGYIYDNKTQMV